MPSGKKTQKTLDKEAAREVLRELVKAHLEPMVLAQIGAARGIGHFFLRDPETGQFQRITDRDQIQEALNAPDAAEGSTYWIFEKDPSTPAFVDLMNRTIDKPTEHVDMNVKGDTELLARLKAGRERVAKGV